MSYGYSYHRSYGRDIEIAMVSGRIGCWPHDGGSWLMDAHNAASIRGQLRLVRVSRFWSLQILCENHAHCF